MNVEFFAVIMCACGERVTVNAWPGEFDGVEHEDPAGWTGGGNRWVTDGNGSRWVGDRDFVCPACSANESRSQDT